MAEAYLSREPHSAVIGAGGPDSGDTSQNRLQVSWNDRGFDLHVPPPRFVWRAARRSFWRSSDMVAVMIYPLPLAVVVGGAAGICLYVWRAPPEAWIHTNPGSTWLRYFHSLLPTTRLIPEGLEPPLLCAQVWALAFGGATVIHRFLLRRLLTYTGWLLEENPVRPGLVTRLWSGLLKAFYIRPGFQRTDVFEGCLPSLPLPPLQQTVSRYLASTRAIYTQRSEDISDWIDVRRASESFLLNEGPALQRHLRFQHAWSPNYVTEWWTRNVLLSARVSLALYSNYFTVPFAAFTPTAIPEARAAVLTYNLVRLKQRLDRRTLPPLFAGPRGCVPMSMEQMFLAFNTTRIPGREVDRLDHDDGDDNNHVIVLHRGHIYQVPVRHPRTRRWLTPHQLEAVFRAIRGEAGEEASTGRDESEEELDGAGGGGDLPESSERDTKCRLYGLAEALLPALTAAPRAQWADIRSNYLLNDANNHHPLRAIERALFVVSFDEKPTLGGGDRSSANSSSCTSGGRDTLSAECAGYLVGNGSNLWCDKSFNLVVCADGRAGVHAEQSWCDPAMFVSLFEHVTALEEAGRPYDGEGYAVKLPEDRRATYADLECILTPRRLRFTIHRRLAQCIREVHTALLTDVVSQVDLHVERYAAHGKNLPKALGCSPDAWMQLAIQLAQLLDSDGVLCQTYEAVALTTFAEGRTEAVRGVSEPSAAFVRAATVADAASRPPKAELLALLRAACAHHQALAQSASAGHGIDRHIFALYMVSATRQVPSDFLNAVMRKAKWKVSSTQVRQRYLPPAYHPVPDCRPFETPGYGFGPVAYDGYGVSYCYCDDGVVYLTVTCMKGCLATSARGFARRLTEALDTLAAISEVDLSLLPGQAAAMADFPQLIENSAAAAAGKPKLPW